MDQHPPAPASRPRSPARRRRPLTVRIAAFSAHHRGTVLAAWLLSIAAVSALGAAVGGQRSLPTATEGPAGGEAAAGRHVVAAAAEAATFERFVLAVERPAGRIDTPAGRAAVASIAARLDAATTTLDGFVVPVFAADPARGTHAVADPFELIAADPGLSSLVLSGDGSTVLIDARITGDAPAIQAKAESLRPLLDELKSAHPDLRILALDTQLINGDLIAFATAGTGWLLLVTLPLTFLILLVAFRAVAASIVPLVLGVGSVAGAMGLVALYSRAVEPVGLFAGEFVVLIGLAVAIDYSLFVITRFRTERAGGSERLAAVETASATAGRAVVFSGLAVIVSLGSLVLVDDPTVRSCAIGAIAVVLVAVIGSLTFLPATLAALDRRIDLGRLPGLGMRRVAAGGPWAPIVRTAIRRPVAVSLGTAALLIAAALPLAGLRLGTSGTDLSVMPGGIEGVQAARLMAAKWPQGSNLTLDVIVTNAGASATLPAIGRLETAVLAVPGVGGPSRVARSADGTVATVSFPLAGGPNDAANQAIVRVVRTDVVPAAFRSVDARVYVSGDAAAALDYASYYVDRLVTVVPVVLALSFVLLLLAFHSIAVPLKAIALNLLSAGSAFGVLTLVFQDGWMTGQTGIRPGVIDASGPVMMFAILFGLSMDYEVFILARIREARDRGLTSVEAVERGVTITSGTVTSAAAIMVCVFAAFFSIGIRNIQEFALGMAVAVLVDATIVRSLLLPATMKLLGDWNWWLPRFLAWIPRVTIEAVEPEPARTGRDAEASPA